MKRIGRLLVVTVGFGALGFVMLLAPQKNATGAAGAPGSFQAAVPSSPTRELVIDFVSVSGIVIENAGFTTVVPVAQLATFSGGMSLPHVLSVQAAPNGNPGEFQLIGSETTRIYADPRTFISFFLNVPGTF